MQNDIFNKWVYFAEQDLNFAKSGFKENFYSHVCFLSQQAVEKMCKAFLVFNKLNYPKTHKIIDIINSNVKLVELLKEHVDEIKLLDAFYIPTRYPDGVPGSLPQGLPEKKDAESSLSTAEKIINIIKKEIA